MSLAKAEQKAVDALIALRNQVQEKYPIGSDVEVRIVSMQKNLTPAVVIAYNAFDVGQVRVRLKTKRQDVRNVHWTNIR